MKQVPPLPLMEFGGKERRRGGKAVAAAGGKMSARSPASRDPTADQRTPTNQNQGKNQFAPREARLTCQLGSCKSPSFSTVSIHQQVRNAHACLFYALRTPFEKLRVAVHSPVLTRGAPS